MCVYGICRDEGMFAERWARSMSEADSVVCLDTGSSDGTAEALRANGVVVAERSFSPWRFDDARNASLELALGTGADVYVCTDLDEFFDEGWRDALESRWDPSRHTRAWYRYDWLPDTGTGEESVGFTYDKVHDASWRWAFPVHETLVRDGSPDYAREEACEVPWSEMRLRHTPDLSKSRGSYLPLLELRVEENPHEPNGLVYLAREYLMHGMPEKAVPVCERAREAVSSIDGPARHETESVVVRYMGEAAWETGDVPTAVGRLVEAHMLDPKAREPLMDAGRVFVELGDYRTAEGFFTQAIESCEFRGAWFEQNSYWTWEPHNWLSVCKYELGDYGGALVEAEIARKLAPGLEEAGHNAEISLERISEMEDGGRR